MPLIVQKFGGSSVGNIERIIHVAERIRQLSESGSNVVVVVSAMGGETDRLLGLARGIQSTPHPRELDVLLSTGEQVTIALLAMRLHAIGCPARSYTGSQVHIRTDSAHTKARIVSVEDRRIREDLQAGRVVVVAGFQGIDESGNITTLGRGGSDTTAVALAAALEADECRIYTDVDGVYTTDPRVEPQARLLDFLTFEEMLELASLGAKVLQIRSVEFARKYGVILRVLSSFNEGPGTLIGPESEDMDMEQPLISGIAFERDAAKITVLGVQDKPGIAFSILGPIADENIEVDMIVQNTGVDGTTDFTFTVNRNDFERTLQITRERKIQWGASSIIGDNKIAKISLVGVGMRSHAGIASRMFKALAAENINILMISTSEIKVSVVVEEKYLELGVRTLHSEFDLDRDDTKRDDSEAR
ncbi:aspartate kinase [Thioalkalivibrio sp. HK1]|uniref:aspartate kinase n=1 Tax=Thioalkalivibrio sp. HK1 TaxID=1469245 RepID=UPI0004720413|nr:aspartate kinase [Thioalkalivibrio sp. HK1]